MKQNQKETQRKNHKVITPTIETTKMFLPLGLDLLLSDIDNTPILIDKEYFNRVYNVENGYTYTLRLGLFTTSSRGIMNQNTALVCGIPTKPAKEQPILALFSMPEFYPVKFIDAVWLKADHPFVMKYVMGSAILESHVNSCGYILRHDTVIVEDDTTIILQNGLRNNILSCFAVQFDVLTIQVEIAFTK